MPTTVTTTDLLAKIGDLTMRLDVEYAENARLRRQIEELMAMTDPPEAAEDGDLPLPAPSGER